MVKLVVFLPHDNSLACLGHLHGTIRVIQSSGFFSGTPELLLVSDNDFSLRILVDYSDVTFKFECFCLEAEVVSQTLLGNSKEVTKIEGWQYIKCMFRFEWERPALSGEVPAHWEQIVRRRGKRQDISDAATHVGVSMIGLAFWNSSENSPIALILSDDADPATLRVCTKKDEITNFISECECVDLNNVKLWATKLVDTR